MYGKIGEAGRKLGKIDENILRPGQEHPSFLPPLARGIEAGIYNFKAMAACASILKRSRLLLLLAIRIRLLIFTDLY
jgi:hypothetical protein